jgi:hypothetical protein
MSAFDRLTFFLLAALPKCSKTKWGISLVRRRTCRGSPKVDRANPPASRSRGGNTMIAGWVGIAFVAFVVWSILFTPIIGIGGIFYAWLAANITVLVLGFFLALQNGE